MVDNAFCQRRELFEGASQCASDEEFIEALKVRGIKFSYSLFCVAHGFLCCVDELFVQRPFLIFASRVVDFIAQFFGDAGVVPEASAQLLELRLDTANNSSEDANAIPQLGGIRRVVDVGFNGGRVDADAFSIFDF